MNEIGKIETQHRCLHEVDIALMAQCQTNISDDLKKMDEKLDKLVDCMHDNGKKKGIMTRVALLEQAKSMSPKKTLALGGGSGISVVAIWEFIKTIIGG